MLNPEKNKDKAKFKVAVYGTLMSNCVNNPLLEDSILLGSFQTEPVYNMYSRDGKFPYIMNEGSSSIDMEVYTFTKQDILDRLDDLEAVNKKLYERVIIKTPYGRAYVYVAPKKLNPADTRINSGNWRDFLNITKISLV